MGAQYNFCISQPAAVLNDPAAFAAAFPGAPPFHSTAVGGLCGPRAQGLNLATGGAPLGGAGYVGGPVPYTPGGVPGNPSGPSPRIYWSMENTDTGDIDKTYANGPSFARYTAWGASITLDWDLSDSTAFKSITASRGIDWKVGVDLDGLPESIQEVTDHQKQDQFSQEFQLTGKALSDKLDYVFGLYYFQEDGFVHDFVPFGSTLYIYDVQNDVDTVSYAAYFHTDYNFNDSFGISLGARWSKDDKKFEGGQADLDGYAYKSSGCWGPVTVLTWRAGRHLRRCRSSTLRHFRIDQPVSLLPAGRAEPGIRHFHADRRRAVAHQPRRDALREFFEGLQGGWLDYTPLESGRRHR